MLYKVGDDQGCVIVPFPPDPTDLDLTLLILVQNPHGDLRGAVETGGGLARGVHDDQGCGAWSLTRQDDGFEHVGRRDRQVLIGGVPRRGVGHCDPQKMIISITTVDDDVVAIVVV